MTVLITGNETLCERYLVALAWRLFSTGYCNTVGSALTYAGYKVVEDRDESDLTQEYLQLAHEGRTS